MIQRILKYKWIVFGVPIFIMLITYIINTFVIDSRYTSTSHIGIKNPTFYANIEPRIEKRIEAARAMTPGPADTEPSVDDSIFSHSAA